MINVSIDGLFEPLLENRGLGPAQLDAIRPLLEEAQKDLMARRGQDIGFYDISSASAERDLRDIAKEATRLRALADDLLVLGIGGSSLGGQAIAQAFAQVADRAGKAHFVDNVDPDTLGFLLERLTPKHTAAVVITKSGGTVETLAQLLIVRRWFRSSLGQGAAQSRMTFVTDPEKGFLRQLANEEGIRAFNVPPNIGGRFSALTAVGLLPAAFLGIDITKIMSGASEMVTRVTDPNLESNPACMFAAGALLAHRELNATSLVMMPYSDALRLTSNWFVQLWAESLGKRLDRKGRVVRAGQTPIAAVGATDQHAQLQLFVEGPQDKVVVLIANKQHRRRLTIPDELVDHDEVGFLRGRELGELLEAERRATRTALLDSGVPVIDITLSSIDEGTFGGLLILLEAACACTGMAMGIDPFDQPGVEAGKRMALGLMGKSEYAEDARRVLSREASS